MRAQDVETTIQRDPISAKETIVAPNSKLVSPVAMGDLVLPNRVIMAPLARSRAGEDGVPGDLAALYYSQRAAAGLIISEGSQISAMGRGYIGTPGIYAPEHVAAWSAITAQVRAAGGRIFSQLWHVGRISHSDLLPQGGAPLSPSAIRANAQSFIATGPVDVSEPAAVTIAQIEEIVEQYGQAAGAARDAGFDGVEIHGANGYLLDQFLQNGVNRRDDRYGGSLDNRLRLLDEVIQRVRQELPNGRIGVRLSPLGQFNDVHDSDRESLFSATYEYLAGQKLAYLHVVEQFSADTSLEDRKFLETLRKRYDGSYIANGGYDATSAESAIARGHADAVSFGQPFIANPDLPQRLFENAPLNAPDRNTFYGGDGRGYVDYPTMQS